eukprot:48047-Amphidinium_carterae.1
MEILKKHPLFLKILKIIFLKILILEDARARQRVLACFHTCYAHAQEPVTARCSPVRLLDY